MHARRRSLRPEDLEHAAVEGDDLPRPESQLEHVRIVVHRPGRGLSAFRHARGGKPPSAVRNHGSEACAAASDCEGSTGATAAAAMERWRPNGVAPLTSISPSLPYRLSVTTRSALTRG